MSIWNSRVHRDYIHIVEVEIRDMKDAFSWCSNTNLLRQLLLLKAIITYYETCKFQKRSTCITVSDWALILPSSLLSQLQGWPGCQKIKFFFHK